MPEAIEVRPKKPTDQVDLLFAKVGKDGKPMSETHQPLRLFWKNERIDLPLGKSTRIERAGAEFLVNQSKHFWAKDNQAKLEIRELGVQA